MSFNTTIDDVVYQKTTGPENIAEPISYRGKISFWKSFPSRKTS